jgi:hypothetical protein
MADTIGIKLEGIVTLGTFAQAMSGFHALLKALTTEVTGPNTIRWEIDDLRPGSAYAAVRGFPETDVEPELVVAAFHAVGQALANNTIVPYSISVGQRANELVAVVGDGSVETLCFFVADEQIAIVVPQGSASGKIVQPIALGVVIGTIEALSRRPQLHITIYDDIFDHAVTCYLNPNYADLARNNWGKRVMVAGRITRDPESGRPTYIHDVFQFEVIEATEPHLRSVRGILPWKIGDPPAEVSVRRLRNAF